MLITKEQQEALVSNYVNEKHNADECIGFIDGMIALMNLLERLDKKQREAKLTNSNHGE